MNEKQTAAASLRPTKKQRELLTFIEAFIAEHGYSPSYREIMTGLNYHSARSLEVVQAVETPKVTSNQIAPGEEKWLVEKVEHAFLQLEELGGELKATSLDHLYVLVGALKVLGLDGAAQSFMPRLSALKQRQTT